MRGGRVAAVDGLRGLALLLVVVFHLFGHGRVSGGVDVFLVLSGYFATSTLLRRAEDGTLRLTVHYARSLARLLPAALVVLGAVTVALLVAPRAGRSAGLREVGAAATSWENWELVRGALAYGAAGPAASPLQHFWSLSVLGQFLAVWPLVVLSLVAVARRSRVGRRRPAPARLVAAVTLAATVASFAHAVLLVGVDQPVAYLSTFARFWELGAGALLALAPGLPGRLPGRLRTALGWAGLALVCGSGLLVDGATAFPGHWTLLPVTGALLTLTALLPTPLPSPVPAGSPPRTTSGAPEAPDRSLRSFSNATSPRRHPDRSVRGVLGSAPLRWGGRVSYALYLWHWPVLVLWLLATGADDAGPLAAAGVLLVSTALAWLTTRWVAEPVLARATGRPAPSARRSPPVADPPPTAGAPPATAAPTGAAPPARWVSAALAGGALLLLGCTQAAAAAHDAAARHDVAGLRVPSPDHPGAAALGPDAALGVTPSAPFRPATWAAADDRPPAACPQDTDRSELLDCAVVRQDHPSAVVYLVGASHELQYQEAFAALAREHGWELREMLTQGCRLATSGEGGLPYPPSCAAWNERALDALVAARPDAVVVVGTHTFEDGSPERVLPGQAGAWRVLADAGVRVVTVRDNPRFEWFVPVCLESENIPDACGRPRAEQLAAVSPLTTADGVPASAVHLDLTDAICGPVTCSAVVGNVLVYRDDDHLTSTYVRTLTPVIGVQLESVAPWLFTGSAVS
ncbi:Peptidoglycan/LPS O-acetylase OafA/YrhL, contains acyltransferase and SGNH-hydrolase domains [Promicromonospora thailandica]|uniref:Peptidoglycan/LPS O-acetylase OafA/YrhL, contains acyltransferase and SGNH-hydrolase domains n=1 Tax=Promicromonospora thailandica TaxID=765201 RepID=A0A9X2G2Z0_9MICO|nr:Peptidoglycan/LPS O-acetylase OafA/YrhL, contains acyltransferase and SGNH-hydrolase domains [Promicromonospora thailandica]